MQPWALASLSLRLAAWGACAAMHDLVTAASYCVGYIQCGHVVTVFPENIDSSRAWRLSQEGTYNAAYTLTLQRATSIERI